MPTHASSCNGQPVCGRWRLGRKVRSPGDYFYLLPERDPDGRVPPMVDEWRRGDRIPSYPSKVMLLDPAGNRIRKQVSPPWLRCRFSEGGLLLQES